MWQKLMALLCGVILLCSLVPPAVAEEPTVPESVKVEAVGAALQQADAKGKATGASVSSMTLAAGSNEFVVTASVPKGKKIDYWVINGVRYDFNNVPKSIRVKDLSWDCTFEAVLKKGTPQTLLTAEAIQSARTGEQLVLQTVNADFYFLKKAKTVGKTAMRDFNFTNDYTNTASGKAEQGGRITARVKAKIPGSKKVDYWLFNQAQFYFSSGVTAFTVTDLNASMVYEPVFAKVNKYFTVSCRGCTFSGGGYTSATTAKVKYGTKIVVKTNYIKVHLWSRNGVVWTKKVIVPGTDGGDTETQEYVRNKSFSWTVKSDCVFYCTELRY